jgi:chromosome segregation ATPase
VDSAITILSARSSIRKVSDVVSSIANQSANRVFLSLISDAVANWQTSIDAADSRVKAVQKTYSDQKIQLQGLNNQMRVLKESLAGLSNVSTQAELSASIRGLNESISLAMKKASDYGEIYPILKTALNSRDAAKAHILEASERVGPTDERISNMTVALKTLSNQVDVKIGAIQDGINVDKTELSNLASDLKALDADAAAIKPVEQEFDYTIAGGIMLLVIAIGGGIWFYLKSKPPKEIPIDQLPPLEGQS